VCGIPERSDLRIAVYRAGYARIGEREGVPYIVSAELSLPNGGGWINFIGSGLEEDSVKILLAVVSSLDAIHR
jgi:hypothetical protein